MLEIKIIILIIFLKKYKVWKQYSLWNDTSQILFSFFLDLSKIAFPN
jgi:hypothetical protein